MSGFTKVIIYGNLTHNPEKHLTSTGTAITHFAVAASRKYKKPEGETKEEPTFIDVRAFGQQAELIASTFKKGNPILIDGHLRLDQWENKAGERRSKLMVVLDTFQYIAKKELDLEAEGALFDEIDESLENPKKLNLPKKEAVLA